MALEQIAARLASPNFGFGGMFTEQRRRADEQDAIAVNAGLLSLDQNYDDLSQADRDEVTQALLKRGATANQLLGVRDRDLARRGNQLYNDLILGIENDSLTPDQINQMTGQLTDEFNVSASAIASGRQQARAVRSQTRADKFIANSGIDEVTGLPFDDLLTEGRLTRGEVLKRIDDQNTSVALRSIARENGLDIPEGVQLTSANVVSLLDKKRNLNKAREATQTTKDWSIDNLPTEEEREAAKKAYVDAFGADGLRQVTQLEASIFSADNQKRSANRVEFTVLWDSNKLAELQGVDQETAQLMQAVGMGSASTRVPVKYSMVLQRGKDGTFSMTDEQEAFLRSYSVRAISLDPRFTYDKTFKKEEIRTPFRGAGQEQTIETDNVTGKTFKETFPSLYNLRPAPTK